VVLTRQRVFDLPPFSARLILQLNQVEVGRTAEEVARGTTKPGDCVATRPKKIYRAAGMAELAALITASFFSALMPIE
jgi:hypothetical protein